MFTSGSPGMGQSLKDELVLAAGRVTPGVDDTPYIQYALEALTRDRSCPSHPTSPSLGRSPVLHRQPTPIEAVASVTVSQPEPTYDGQRPVSSLRHDTPPEPATASAPAPTTLDTRPLASGQWIPVDRNTIQTIDPRGQTYPPLTFKPRILRPFSFMTLMTLCILMIAALVFAARFSDKNTGLTPYPGTIYSGQYFVFRILPQLLAAMILIFSQSIVTASLRVLPFTIMAREDPAERYLALFQNLYPKSFLRPQLVGPWQVMVFDLATWAAALTIPLHSAAFTCIYVDDVWIWAPSKGLVWALVLLYAFLLAAAAISMSFWFNQWTGLRWDMRSIADLIPLLSRTNTMGGYKQRPVGDLKTCLHQRCFDRLGYWQTGEELNGGIWHAIGTSVQQPPGHGTEANEQEAKRRGSHDLSLGSRHVADSAPGGSYLPLCLRDGPLVAFAATTGILLLAMLVASFLPQTRLEAGFSPMLTAKPTPASFSLANFVYSFVPACLGMILFMLFQIFDQSLRIVQPWGDMVQADGAIARRSILVDYAACLPLQVTWRALVNGHWRVAVTSLMALLFIFIPVLAGGLFTALTTPDAQVRMFPSMPVFGVLLAFLFLYVACLCLLMPRRSQFMLPHAATSAAAIISLCSADDLIQDAAFQEVRSHGDVKARLGVGRGDDSREETVWFFGLLPGRDEQRLSVRRMKRLTERGMRSARDMV
ncbi:hypothetical protein RJ55_01772 [Drechmeria coniospora]|nr:hypothetical protein RJ55_01772 [Drechmeria coniospora]